jgi:hypothetical protein
MTEVTKGAATPKEQPAVKKESELEKEPEKEPEKEKIGGPDDLIIVDDLGNPVEAVETDEDVAPFRLTHKKVVYERVGEDEDGRATYRKSG